jgi:hypothetical protein
MDATPCWWDEFNGLTLAGTAMLGAMPTLAVGMISRENGHMATQA